MTDEAINRIIVLCDEIQKKLGDDDKSLHDLLEIMFESAPGDTWWNVREALNHLSDFFRPPPMTIEEFIKEMTKRNFIFHVMSNDPDRQFTIKAGPFHMHIFTDDYKKECYSQLIYGRSQTVATKNFPRRFSQDTSSLACPFDGMLAIVDKALREIPIFLVLET